MKIYRFLILFFAAVIIPAITYSAPAENNTRTLELGFEQRVRNENWDNLFDFNSAVEDQRNQVRYRTRAWAKIPLSANVDIYAGLLQETNQIIAKSATNRFDEIVFEHLYLDFKKLGVQGLSLRVGRQNIIKGEGFVVLDGTYGDGSRSLYFNAFDLAYAHKKSKFEIIGILQPRTDRFLPQIHDRSRLLSEWNEQAIGGYFTDNNLKNTSLEAYYFYKKETGDVRAKTSLLYLPDRHVQTTGGRIVQKLKNGWEATGELAIQRGAQRPATPVKGMGGYGYIKKSWQSQWRPSLSAGYFGMSGDNPSTKDKYEGWDPIFSRWPKYSELYLYSTVRERGVAYWTNIGIWQTELLFNPTKKVAGRLTYYHMNSFYTHPGDPNLFGTGKNRGNNYQVRVDYNANKYWKGHVLFERHNPGSFYAHNTPAYFLRFEVIYTFRVNRSM